MQCKNTSAIWPREIGGIPHDFSKPRTRIFWKLPKLFNADSRMRRFFWALREHVLQRMMVAHDRLWRMTCLKCFYTSATCRNDEKRKRERLMLPKRLFATIFLSVRFTSHTRLFRFEVCIKQIEHRALLDQGTFLIILWMKHPGYDDDTRTWLLREADVDLL